MLCSSWAQPVGSWPSGSFWPGRCHRSSQGRDMGPVGKRHPEHPTFMLVQWKTGRMGPWLLAREAEAIREGAFIFAREDMEMMGLTDWEPYFNGKRSRIDP